MRLSVAVLLSIAVSAALDADTLRLKNGDVISGTFAGGNRDEVRFQPDGSVSIRRFNVGEVDSLLFGGPAPAGPYSNNPGAGYPAPANYPPNGPYTRNSPPTGGESAPYGNPQYGNNQPGTAPPPVNPSAPQPPPANGNGGYDSYGNYTGAPSDRYSYGSYNGNTQASANISASSLDVLPAGTVLVVRTLDRINSDVTHAGDTFRASLDQPIVINGQTIAPAGSDATLEIVRVQRGDALSGHEEISIALRSFMVNGVPVTVNTSNEQVNADPKARHNAAVIGGTTVFGAILGAAVGGGRGAAIGAVSGAAVGTTAQVLRGQTVKVAPETRLSFTLTRDLAFHS